jgi:hypothetical protein
VGLQPQGRFDYDKDTNVDFGKMYDAAVHKERAFALSRTIGFSLDYAKQTAMYGGGKSVSKVNHVPCSERSKKRSCLVLGIWTEREKRDRGGGGGEGGEGGGGGGGSPDLQSTSVLPASNHLMLVVSKGQKHAEAKKKIAAAIFFQKIFRLIEKQYCFLRSVPRLCMQQFAYGSLSISLLGASLVGSMCGQFITFLIQQIYELLSKD